MEGIVSLLDPHHDRLIRDLWDELAQVWGISAVAQRVPFPHFSYQVASAYDVDDTPLALAPLVTQMSPFIARTSGLGVFTGPEPVLYISICRNETLSALHGAIWDNLSGSGKEFDQNYQPEQWQPHITLAQGDLDRETLARIVAAYCDRDFRWEIAIDHLATITATETACAVRHRFDFGGEAPEALLS